MNNNYRLQLRHCAEEKNFSTRDDVFAYIDGQLQYGGVSLLPYEPILFYYGEDEKNTIIMVGLPEGQFNNGKSYFIIDTADLKEQIDALDEKYDAAIEELKAKDAELQEAIETEAEARAEKDTELEKAIEDEAEARAKKDAELQEALEFTKDDLKSVIEACGLIYNEKLAEDRVSYVPDSHDEVIRDAKDITEAINKISKFAVQLAKDLKINVANTDTVNLTLTPNDNDGGNTITADVNIAGTEGLSKKNYDNNIIGKTVEGLYASASLEPSTTNPNKLIFKTSGYIDGAFKVDAFETEVDLTAYKGDNGKNTGITVSVDTNENKISAELNLSSDKNNILKLEDGEYVVEGTSKNITYKDATVFSALNEHSNRIEEIEDTIEFVKAVDVKPSESDTVSVTVDKSAKGDFVVGANVKLSNDKSIIVSNGGLKADVSASFKKGTSTLFINVGNNEYAIDLSDLAVSVLKSAKYDAGTEELVLEFIVGDTTKTVRVPVGTLIHDIEVDDTDTVDMTLKSVSGGPNHISAEVKVDKTHSDNILTITSNGLYVAKAYITEAVKEEADARKAADDEIKATLANVSELANSNKEAIATEASTARAAEKANADAIAQEIKDARKAEEANANAIAENKTAIKANEVAIGAEEGRAKAAEQANATAITAEETRAMAAETKNASDINAEITRATEKEADLLGKIGDNTEKINENKSAIVSEVERATKAEKEINDKTVANDTAIKAEVTRAKAAEGVNAQAVVTEKERAMAAESVLDNKVENAQTTANNASTTASNAASDLAKEIERATKAEEANAQAVVTEKERAKEKEGDLEEKIAKNTLDIANLTSEVGDIELRNVGDMVYALYVNGTKHGEITIPKDQFLKSATYDPTTKDLVFVFNTAAGETTTKISIADLVDTYEAGNGLVLNGKTFSVDATIAIKSEVTNAINAEYSRATLVEEALKNRVANVESVSTINGQNIAQLGTNLTEEITRAKGAESLNAKSILDETNRAKAKEAEISADVTKNKNDISTLTSDLASETLRASNSESAIRGMVENETTRARGVESSLSERIIAEKDRAVAAETELTKNLKQEADRAAARENELTLILNNKADSADVYTKSEVLQKFAEYSTTEEINSKLSEKANVSDLEGKYATKKELSDLSDVTAKKEDVNAADKALSDRIKANEVALGEINLTYNAATSELTYIDTKGTSHVYKLYSGSLIKKGEFNPVNNSIVLTIENAGIESQITIPVSELLSDLDAKITHNTESISAINDALGKLAKDWEVRNSQTVELVKSTVGEKDSLTANVRIASSNKQAIQSKGDGIYVSNDLEDFTCVFGGEGTISAQNAISKLLEGSNSMKSEMNNLTEKVTKNTSDIEKLESRVDKNENDIITLKSEVSQNTKNLEKLETRVDKNEKDIATLESKVSTLETKVSTLETKVSGLETQVNTINNEISTLKDTVREHTNTLNTLQTTVNELKTLVEKIVDPSGTTIPQLLAEIDKIKNVTAYDTYDNAKNMSVRLDEITNKLDGNNPGDVTYEINNIKNNIIGNKTNPVDGSVWYELNNMVDAGTF